MPDGAVRYIEVERGGDENGPSLGWALLLNYSDTESARRLVSGGDLFSLDYQTGEAVPALRPKAPRSVASTGEFQADRIWKENPRFVWERHIYLFQPGEGWTVGCHRPSRPLQIKKFKPGEDNPEPIETKDNELAGLTLSRILDDEVYREILRDRVRELYPAQYGKAERTKLLSQFGKIAGDLGRTPLNGQLDAILKTALSIGRNRGTNLVGEMGTGKTTISIMAARLSGTKSALILCPPHLTRKWKREILATVPKAEVYIVERIRPERGAKRPNPNSMDIQTIERRLAERKGQPDLADRPLYAILAHTKASLGYAGNAGVMTSRLYRDHQAPTSYREAEPDGTVRRKIRPTLKAFWTARKSDRDEPEQTDPSGVAIPTAICPDCFDPVLDPENLPYREDKYWSKRLRCQQCGGALWQARRQGVRDSQHASVRIADERAERKAGKPAASWQSRQSALYSGAARYPLGDYIAKRLRRRFDLLIADEAHEFKSASSARGIVAGNLARSARRCLTLTGTIMGGYSSNLFHLLYRFSGSLDSEFSHNEQSRWIRLYGFQRRTQRKERAKDRTYSKESRGYSGGVQVKETPGLSPAALPYILSNTVFIGLSDVAPDLPSYSEEVRLVGLDESAGPKDYISHAEAYQQFAEELSSAVAASIARGSQKLLSRYLHSLMSWPDLPTVAQSVLDEENEEVASAPALSDSRLYPKERELAELVKREAQAGRRVMVYLSYTNRRNTAPRIEAALAQTGLVAKTLDARVKPTSKREAVISRWVKEGLDVLIVNPLLVQTGLDLTDFPTICWYQPTYSTYTMRQASRRSWRIGQTEPVKVIHLIYQGAFQADALALIAKKARTSLAVEGELSEEGLSAYGDDSDDPHLALAKKVIAQKGSVQPEAADLTAELDRLVRSESERSRPLDRPAASLSIPKPASLTTTSVTTTPNRRPTPKPKRMSELERAVLKELAELTAQVRPAKRAAPAGLSLFDAALERLPELEPSR